MARGKYLSFEEARKKDVLKQFIREHPSVGDEKAFDRLFEAMALPKHDDDDENAVSAG